MGWGKRLVNEQCMIKVTTTAAAGAGAAFVMLLVLLLGCGPTHNYRTTERVQNKQGERPHSHKSVHLSFFMYALYVLL